MHWLTEVPLAVVAASRAMLPRLEAQEAIHASTVVGIGTGSYQKDDARKIREDWARTAGGPEQPRRRPVRASARDLGAIGIGVRRVPRKKPIQPPEVAPDGD